MWHLHFLFFFFKRFQAVAQLHFHTEGLDSTLSRRHDFHSLHFSLMAPPFLRNKFFNAVMLNRKRDDVTTVVLHCAIPFFSLSYYLFFLLCRGWEDVKNRRRRWPRTARLLWSLGFSVEWNVEEQDKHFIHLSFTTTGNLLIVVFRILVNSLVVTTWLTSKI